MKKNYLRPNLLIFLLLLIIGTIIHSCKKYKQGDLTETTITDQQLLLAEKWYEGTYPVLAKAESNVKTQTTSSESNSGSDYSQMIKPDWKHALNYNRFNKRVLEIPIDPSAKFSSALKNTSINQISYKKEYSKSSFLILFDGKNYEAYIMTILADSAYIKNDLSKLAHNTYSKHDIDFSGMVMYFTPKGTFVGGYLYKNGQIVPPQNSNVSSSTKVQSTGNPNIKSMSQEKACWDYWLVSYDNGVEVSREYLYTLCEIGDGSGGGSGGGGSGPTYSPPAPPCAISGSSISRNLIVQNVPSDPSPGDGGGFPPPTDPCTLKSSPYTPTAQTIRVDSLAKHFPCATALIVNNLGGCGAYSDLVQPFVTGQKPDLIWQDATLIWNASDPNNSSSKIYQLGQTQPETSGLQLGATITLNTKMLQNSSKLLIASTAVHETLHAFINYNVSMAAENKRQGYITNGSWLYSIDSWININGLPSNYSNHYEMLSAYFDKAVTSLAELDNYSHTTKEYQMSMLYGLDNGVDGTPTQQQLLQVEFNSILTKYNITRADLDTFNQANLNATSANKLPTSGCN